MANQVNRRNKIKDFLTKRQASFINKGNRNISGNINSLQDNLDNMTYGIQKTGKIDSLIDEFNSLLKGEIDDINRTAEGDVTSFITKLFSDNKKITFNAKDINTLFNSEENQLQSFITEQYKNRLIKQNDLHEVASQLVELKQAITITRDAIISADIINGHMSRTLTIDNDLLEDDREDYIPIIENMEKKFQLQRKIKNFIITRSLEYGEFYVYCVPYSKLFEDFSKEKLDPKFKYNTYSESVKTLSELINNDSKNKIIKTVTESVMNTSTYEMLYSQIKDTKKNISKEFESYLDNVSVCNTHVPICVLEEGVESYKEYYREFVEKSIYEKDAKDKNITFDKVMKGIDVGMHSLNKNSSKSKDKKSEDFGNIKDCYIKLINPMNILPIKIMDEVIGYYYIQEEDISPLSGILTSTVYYDKFDNDNKENTTLNIISDLIVDAFDKKFLEKNMKFKKLIVEALNYFKLNNKKVRFQFIPKEYIVPFKINTNEHGEGVSIIEDSLFYAKLYLMILLFKIMTIIMNSNDTKVNYIKQSGIEKNITNKIQEIARKKQQRQITLTDMFSYTNLVNKIGQGSEMYIPVGKSGERGIETEILSGQDVQLNNDLLELLKKSYISGTGVPDVLMNYFNEADFAKTLELANNRFHGSIVSHQLDYNEQITELYKLLMKFSTNIPESIIDSFTFNFVQPKYSNSNITNDLINNHNTYQEFLIQLYFSQEEIDNPEFVPIIKKFRKSLAEERLTDINFANADKIYKDSFVQGTADILNPNHNSQANNNY